MLLIKVSEGTAARRRVPVALVDDTDGKTAKTGITISAGDVKVSKNGAAEANHGGALTELAAGDYYYEFSAGEVDTVGYLTARIVKATVRTFRIAAQVVAFDPYDAAGLGLSRVDAAVSTRATQTSLDLVKTKTDQLAFTGANRVDANLAAVNNNTGGVAALDRAMRAQVLATVTTGATTTSIPTSSLVPAASVLDQFKGRVLLFDKDTATAALRGQGAVIIASTAAGILTVTALTTAPASGDTAVIV